MTTGAGMGGRAGAAVRSQYFVGLDLGQARDYTALAVLERAELRGDWDAAVFAYRKETEL